MKKPDNTIIIFKTDDARISADVRFQDETAWLTLGHLAALFERNKSTVSRHIKNIFDEGELRRDSVIANFATKGIVLTLVIQHQFLFHLFHA